MSDNTIKEEIQSPIQMDNQGLTMQPHISGNASSNRKDVDMLTSLPADVLCKLCLSLSHNLDTDLPVVDLEDPCKEPPCHNSKDFCAFRSCCKHIMCICNEARHSIAFSEENREEVLLYLRKLANLSAVSIKYSDASSDVQLSLVSLHRVKPKLRSLTLSSTALKRPDSDDSAMKSIDKALLLWAGDLQRLQIIRKECSLFSKVWEISSTVLTNLSALRELELDNVFPGLTTQLVSGFSSLFKLTLRGKRSGIKDGDHFELDLTSCTSLQELCCTSYNVSVLDLTGLTALQVLNCSKNVLVGLNLSTTTALLDLDCSYNILTALDLTSCVQLRLVQCMCNDTLTDLQMGGCLCVTHLSCAGSPFTELPLSSFTSLTIFNCCGAIVSGLDLQGCVHLKQLFADGCDNLVDLKLSGMRCLELVRITHGSLTSLDLSECTALKDVSCPECVGLTMLSVSDCLLLSTLCVERCALQHINLTDCVALSSFDCSGCPLEILDLSTCSALQTLKCSETLIRSLDLQSCLIFANLEAKECRNLVNVHLAGLQHLKTVIISETGIETLDLTECIALTSVSCLQCCELVPMGFGWSSKGIVFMEGCGLRHINLTGCVSLLSLDCSCCPLKALELSSCTALQSLNYSQTLTSSLDLQRCVCLSSLQVEDCRDLANVHIAGLQHLKTVSISQCSIKTLDMSGCIALEKVSLRHRCKLDKSNAFRFWICKCEEKCGLQHIDLTGCASLIALYCSHPALSILDVSSCAALQILDCSWTQISSLDLQSCLSLSSLAAWECRNLVGVHIAGLQHLKTVSITHSGIKTLDMTGCMALEQVSLHHHCKLATRTESGFGRGSWTSACLCKDKCGPQHISLTGCVSLLLLDCSSCPLEFLDLSPCAALRKLNCSGTCMGSLDLQNCLSLAEIDASNCKKLLILDLSGQQKLQSVRVHDSGINSLDLSMCTALQTLACTRTSIHSLCVQDCLSLATLEASECRNLTDLDLTGMHRLQRVNLSNSGIKSLDMAGCSALGVLSCPKCSLEFLDVSACAATLFKLECYGCSLLTAIVAKGCCKLRAIACGGCPIVNVDCEGCTDLRHVTCDNPERLSEASCTSLSQMGVSLDRKHFGWQYHQQ